MVMGGVFKGVSHKRKEFAASVLNHVRNIAVANSGGAVLNMLLSDSNGFDTV